MLAVSLPQSISSPWSNQSTNLHRDEGFSCGKKIRDSNPLRSKNYLAFLHPCRLGHGRPRLSQTPENFNLQLRLSWAWTQKQNSHVWAYTQNIDLLCECGRMAGRKVCPEGEKQMCEGCPDEEREILADFLVPGFRPSSGLRCFHKVLR